MKKTREKPSSILELMKEVDHISDICIAKDGKITYYVTSEDGIGTIHEKQAKGNKQKAISGAFNVRGTVGYGGGSFDLREDLIVFCDKSGSIHRINLKTHGKIKTVIPSFVKTCSPKLSPDSKWVIFIYEQNEVNGVGIAATNGLSWPRQLALGADFYMHPVWHPEGEMIAWAEWDHPDMPWDAARIKIGQLGGMQLRLLEEEYIDGKRGQSANQPKFSPDGKWLSYIKRNDNWDDLVLYNLKSKEKSVLVKGDGFHLRMPDWLQGLHSYQWSGDSKSIFFIKYHQGTASLSKVDLKAQSIRELPVADSVWLSHIDISAEGKTGVVIGSGFTSGDRVHILDLAEKKTLEKKSGGTHSKQEAPESIIFTNREGQTGHAWFYSAKSSLSGSVPAPCIITLHSGPTSLKHAGYSPDTEFFRRNGFSVAHLNYRGSVSFGYDYQYALERRWGDAEVEDTLDLIIALSDKALINRDKLVLMGSSAGGFSVLHLLIKHPGIFKATVCAYAVSDLVDDAKNTHKFEKYYHRFLTGNFPEEESRFINRSPISHISKIKDPVALFHGADDPVVSVKQSEQIHAELQKNGIPCTLTIFDGEGHGFRKNENIETYYSTILAFLNKHI